MTIINSVFKLSPPDGFRRAFKCEQNLKQCSSAVMDTLKKVKTSVATLWNYLIFA